ncbi:putative O-methyltransferase [Zopfia rhizophila CBS 207.26]|uniref:Putative O-methyltransferase n=1 Tax=Zopfia rhizophila CBS 207.26 TaxID=1314779 RepID=A0A6A6E386_9PEZI|nr:putative O-methyltransferase [Zopfia rhizophila CBS 207.26]
MAEATPLIDELSALSKRPGFATDAKAQARAVHLSKQIALKLQHPVEAAIELSFYPTFTAAARVAVDLKLFNLIAESSGPISAVDLAKASSGAENLIVRLLRPLAALGFVQEVGENKWTATPITHVMSAPAAAAAHIHFWDQGNRSMSQIQTFFKQNGYRQPEDPRKGILQHAFGTDKEAFEYWHKSPEILDNFNTFMVGNRRGKPSWVEWWPGVKQIIEETKLDDGGVMLVDVAGNRGHDTEAFKKKFPDVKGRLVVEDLPPVINDIIELDPAIEKVNYDFFTPQPIKDARMYFFHFIMHDWSDPVCIKILSNTISAMKKGHSKIVLNEFILPNERCPLFQAGFDLQMMTMHAGQERTESQWRALLAQVGLKVNGFWVPEHGGEGIIEAEIM